MKNEKVNIAYIESIDSEFFRKLKLIGMDLIFKMSSIAFCDRYNLNKIRFLEDDFYMQRCLDEFGGRGEFEKISVDLRLYKNYEGYELEEISIEEYDKVNIINGN